MNEPRSIQNLLFLCTGNYYRSRIAEAVFNYLAIINSLNWRAQSRGFRPKSEQMGLSPIAHDFLVEQKIQPDLTAPCPRQLTVPDLVASSIAIALYESEHRPMMQSAFPDWAERVIYWQVPDIDVLSAEKALPILMAEVQALFDQIKAGEYD
jgi:protein-tyrosine phosphatase